MPPGHQAPPSGTRSPAQSNQSASLIPAIETKTTQAIPDAEGVYEVGNGVLPPKVISSVDPEYPDQARKKKLSGSCVIGLVVDVEGSPRDIHVARSVAEDFGPKLKKAAESLDQNAMKAVSQYRFKPAEYQGKPVPVHLKIRVDFQIY